MPNCQSKHAVPPPPKSQYELERDERIKRAPRRPQSSSAATSCRRNAARRVGDPHAGNKAVMASLGFEEGAPTLKKAPPKPRAPKPYVPESERRRSPRLKGETIALALTYDLSDDEGPKRRSQSSCRKRDRVVDDLSDEQRAALPVSSLGAFLLAFEAWMEPDGEHPVSEQNRRSVIRQVRKLVSGEGVTYSYWPDGVVFRKDEPVTMQSDISKIIDDARDYEGQYGEDRGHGWLLKHPLRKLLFYQHYLDTKARLAPAAKAPPTKPTKATTPTKKAKKAKTSLVGRKVHKNFIGEGGWFDGVVKSVKDGKCRIAWSDKTESTMKDTAVQKILV